MFPKVNVNIDQIGTPTQEKFGRVFLFDPITKRHVIRDGKLVETTEIEAVKQWIELLLKTQFGRYSVYKGTRFGLNMSDLIGQKQFPLLVIQSMIEQEIKDKARDHVLIQSIVNFSIKRLDKGLEITFKVILKNGKEQGVNAIVDESEY